MTEREAIIWCPQCKADRYELHRVPTGKIGVFEHVTVPATPTAALKYCQQCGAVLERKPEL